MGPHAALLHHLSYQIDAALEILTVATIERPRRVVGLSAPFAELSAQPQLFRVVWVIG